MRHALRQVGAAGFFEHRHRLGHRRAVRCVLHDVAHDVGGALLHVVGQAVARQFHLHVGRQPQRLLGARQRRDEGFVQARFVAGVFMHHGRRNGAAHAGVFLVAHRLVEVADDGGGLHRVALAHQRLHQLDVVFGVAKLRVFGLADDLLEHPLGGFGVAGFERHLAQFAQPPDRVRRHRHRLGQHRLRFVELADGGVGLGQPVVGIDEFLVAVDQILEHALGLGKPFAHEQRLGQPQPGPGDRLGLDQLLVDRLGFGRFAEEHVQLGAQAQKIDGVTGIGLHPFDTGGDRLALVTGFHQLIDRHEGVAALQRAGDPLEQAVGGERLEDVIGGRQFGRADHLAVSALGGHHEEHGRQADQLVVAQVLEQLLAVLPAFEVVFAQHQVEAFQGQVAYRVVGVAGMVDLGQSAQGQHAVDARAHAGMRLDNQRGESV